MNVMRLIDLVMVKRDVLKYVQDVMTKESNLHFGRKMSQGKS